MTDHRIIDPEALAKARGFSHGILAASGRLLFVAGQIGWDGDGRVVSPDFLPQFEQALANVVQVVRAAGGRPSDLVRLTLYVIDKRHYEAQLPEVGAAYRRRVGRHYPAMALLEVKGLLEPGALVEVEATAVIPDRGPSHGPADTEKAT